MGGLAAAACLRRGGVDLTVYERAAVYGRVGLGLLLLPNGMGALDRLGLGSRARELARPLDLAVLRRPDATFIKCMALEHHLGIVRADLTELLSEAVPRRPSSTAMNCGTWSRPTTASASSSRTRSPSRST